MKLNDNLIKIITEHHENGVKDSDCNICSSGCCSRGGFAILENVVKIFELYQNKKLKRKGYKFKKGLNLKEFIFEYFDVWERNVSLTDKEKIELIFFHMKSIDKYGHTISIPGDSYWKIRGELFDRNPWLNNGCVFLSHPVLDWPKDDEFTHRKCILHSEKANIEVTAKPIDCVFYTCEKPFKAKTPKSELSDQWFYELAVAFPDSKERFENIAK